MAYQPLFSISPDLLALVEQIAILREKIQSATIELAWVPALQKDSRSRNVHASTAIEGNPLTLEQVRQLEEGKPLTASDEGSEREVLNYFAGLRYIEKNAAKKKIGHEDVFKLHRILAKDVMNQGDTGKYRTISVRVGDFMPPAHAEVSGLMFELLEWLNGPSKELSPVISSAIFHHRFETIHPFADGNGRTAERWQYGSSTGAASTHIISFRLMNTTGKIVIATMPSCKPFGNREMTFLGGSNTQPRAFAKLLRKFGCAYRVFGKTQPKRSP